MDSRIKLLCMLLFSLSASFASEPLHYLVPFCIAVAALITAKLPILTLLKDMKIFAVFILIIFVSNAFTAAGDPIPGFPFEIISIQGVVRGARFAGRLILIITICSVATGTTSLMSYKNTIEWYLRPVPFVPETRVATMISLIFVLIPVIFDNYTEMMNAQRSRCIELRKNPIKRLMFIVFPLFGRTLKRADEIVYAMESRCYSETRTRALFKTNKADWLILTISVSVLLFVVL